MEEVDKVLWAWLYGNLPLSCALEQSIQEETAKETLLSIRVLKKIDILTEEQHDDEVIEGKHDEEEGQHDDEVIEEKQDDEFAKFDVGELMFSLARLNKMNDWAYVPTTFGDRLIQLRRLGEADKTTLLDGLAVEDRACVEKEMQDEMEQNIEELAKGMDETGRAKVIKKMEITYRGKTSKYASIGDFANGEKFWCATLSLPWYEPSVHITTEEKLNMIQNDCITDVDKAHIVKLLDSSQVSTQSFEGLPNDKAKVRDWLHMYCFLLQVNQYGLGLLLDIQNADQSLSTIEKAKFLWWLDMAKNHVPDEKLELFQQHNKAALQLTTTTNSILEEDTMATSQVVATTTLASFCKTLSINLGREVMNRALQANKGIEDGKMQGQHQSASSNGRLRENDDITNETLEPTGSVDVFDLSS
ncbi:hypothetical protein L7F22_029935 [Adiantum nelumboides]|nr:hypothetical protein [Adiantum nelumboides]